MKTFKVYIRENGKLTSMFMEAPSLEVLNWNVQRFAIVQIVEVK